MKKSKKPTKVKRLTIKVKRLTLKQRLAQAEARHEVNAARMRALIAEQDAKILALKQELFTGAKLGLPPIDAALDIGAARMKATHDCYREFVRDLLLLLRPVGK